MRRAYATLPGPEGDWQIHYREAGSGPPALLLHPSPLSSAFLEPLAEELGRQWHCLALDTPGYGHSDPLPTAWAEHGLRPYLRALEQFLDALAIERAFLYGSATGAQIAIEFAKTHPQRCRGLLLENVAVFTDEERDALLKGYFPDLTPTDDGAHLHTLWTMASQSTRYFPWYDRSTAAQRRDVPSPAAAVQAMVRDYLLAGTAYDRAYQAAFANERADTLDGLTVPTRIVQWRDGLLGEYARRLEDIPLPAGIALVHADHGPAARLAATLQAAADLSREYP